ncbi:4Fe-4S binding protein [Methanobacterium formicicum]|uniref:4Fe-4S ferredoxin n=1 Tax=Methanobacterium formicicum (strain DSM 3637 / PP1) TaxID=1204725 RepID=K2RF04_METFP|nr:ferredoxin family protein [Methanobacterium formicicum]EKF86974.1 4Fe-4S ferredoxin [Methanobacterium formicicum DSM 3637]
MRIEVDPEKCTGCGICKEECPKGAKIWDVNNKAMATNLRYCHICTICASKCPEGAILIVRDDPNEPKKQDTEEDL